MFCGSESNRADSGGNLCKSGARGDQVEVDEDMGVQQHLVDAELMARGVNRLEVADITGTWK